MNINHNEWPEYGNHPESWDNPANANEPSVILNKDQYNLARKCVLNHENMVELCERILEQYNGCDWDQFNDQLEQLK